MHGNSKERKGMKEIQEEEKREVKSKKRRGGKRMQEEQEQEERD